MSPPAKPLSLPKSPFLSEACTLAEELKLIQTTPEGLPAGQSISLTIQMATQASDSQRDLAHGGDWSVRHGTQHGQGRRVQARRFGGLIGRTAALYLFSANPPA